MLQKIFCLRALHGVQRGRLLGFGAGKFVVAGVLFFNAFDEGRKPVCRFQKLALFFRQHIACQVTGQGTARRFNPKFLIDALRVIDDENVTIYMVNPKAPCYIKDDEQKYVYLILPVNFNTAVN